MKIAKWIGLLLLLVVLIVLPFLMTDAGNQSIAIYTLLYASAVTGWNILSGYSGYVSLGYTSFLGLGTYTMAIICDHWKITGDYTPFLLLPLCGLVAAIFAVPMGWIALRTKRVIFVVVTIAMTFVLQALAFNLSQFTDGSSGIIFPATQFPGDAYNYPYYFVALGLFVVIVAISWWVRNSKYGLGLLAIRDDEDHALGLGVKAWAFKLSAFVLSAFLGGLVGGVLAYYAGSIFPDSAFNPALNLTIALMGFFGGMGTLAGPVVGAFLLEPFQQYLTIEYGSSDWNLIILGVLLLLTLLFLPEGIVPSLRKLWIKWAARRSASTPVSSGVREPEAVALVESASGE